MKIISVNAGSSTLKFSLFEMNDESVIASGLFERIGIDGSFYTIKFNNEKIKEEIDLPNQEIAVKVLLDKLIALNIINSLDEIEGIGHRVVSGAYKYKSSVIITNKVIDDIDEIKDFAPLHNPDDVLVMRAFKEVLPNTLMVAVFDTTFHQDLEPVNYLYPVPYDWYQNYHVRKYGAHGTSYRYLVSKIEELEGRKDLRIIACHLGGGGSVCAIKNGKSIDTSIGFTPLSGIMMGTRSGNVDPSIIPYIMEKEGKNALEVIDDLNHRSGLLGLSEVSSDARDIEKGVEENNEMCILAREKYCRTVVSYIAQYYVLLGGVDVLVFTAGIGENNIGIRENIVEKLSCLGLKIDKEKNNFCGEIRKISTSDSNALVYVIPANEELIIARDTVSFINR